MIIAIPCVLMIKLDQKPLKVDTGTSLKRMEGSVVVSVDDSEREMENCRNRCCELELKLQNRNNEFELLEAKFRALEAENIATVDELWVLKKRNLELRDQITRVENDSKVSSERNGAMGKIVDLTEENDEEKVVQLMIENKVLDCEKKRAESETEVWKVKGKELESRVLELEKEISVLRNVGLGSPEVFVKKTSEESEVKDGISFRTSLGHLQVEEKVVDGEGTRVAGIEGSSCFPLEGTGELHMTGMSLVETPGRQSIHVEGGNRSTLMETELYNNRRVRKQLAFGEEGCSNKKMAPSTPGGSRSASVHVIDICDSNDEPDTISSDIPNLEIQGNKVVYVPTDFTLGCIKDNEKKMASNNSIKKSLVYQSNEEDMGGYKGNSLYIKTPKRKRAPNIVISDSESDDDNIPICEIRRKHLQELYHDPTDSHLNSCSVTVAVSGDKVRESVTPMPQCEIKGGSQRKSRRIAKYSETKNHPSIPTNEDVEDDEMEEDGSESEGESLGGFIVDSSDCSKSSDVDKASSESEDVSDDNTDFSEIISRIRRNRGHKSNWEFEADMLAAFGKDPELCMKAVCALYRQQTTEERSSKGTIYSNQRGFSQCDALRGTNIAEFLIDGDPEGDLNKSVEELQEYNHKGLELCRTLATRYSKQLFSIYSNKEDPLFLPD
ncbi:uncharacterized protein LOC132312724 [Cornus florida]|uniref:uncharacterized protein LOC132312724 n=1 Tax=Cornus florida TaxID=4283 RepID=UPI0028A0E671|nr:uncharacterized protein LOC132312724 [Cornus florida]